MRILITGASGFVARQVIPYFIDAGAEIVLVGRSAEALKLRYPLCVCGEYSDWNSLAAGVDAVLHLAVVNNDRQHNQEELFRANVGLVGDVLEKAKASGVPQLIFTSSLHARDGKSQSSLYGRSKKEAEDLLLAASGIRVRIYQLAAVYGHEFSGRLRVLNAFPAPVRAMAIKLLGALRPTLHARKLAETVLSAVNDPKSEIRVLSDEQWGNPVFEMFKRGVDLLFVLVVGFLFSWLIALVWLAVKLTSEGPGIFAQERVGKSGGRFICYKFRTMHNGTKQVGTHELSQASVTKIGVVLRKTKIDELPQIVNILRGEMSLIGPRPCLPSQVELIKAREGLGVLDVLPGISGWSQIKNIDMSAPEKLARSDAEYIALRSIPLELKIIAATLLGGGQGDKVRQP